MPVCPYCQTLNLPQVTQCTSCGAGLGAKPGAISSRTSPQSLPSGTRLDDERYALKGVIGHGAFGLTYKALHKASLEIVAIKEHFPSGLCERNPNGRVVALYNTNQEYAQSLDRFYREGEVLAQLRHPSNVEVRGSFQAFGTSYLVMEFLEGQTLEQRLVVGARLAPNEALELLRDLLGALEELHALGFLHRDLKPANIMLTTGRAELMDFGSVTRFDALRAVRVSARLLTPAYAPLEQYATEVRLSPATDLYALAASVYEALCARAPESALARANGMPMMPIQTLNPGVPDALARVLESALNLRVDARPASARAMLDALGLKPKGREYGPNSEAW